MYLEWNIDVTFSKYQKSTTKQKFKISKNYVAPDSASVEACREVRGCISMSHFFVKISYLNICSLIFWNSYQKSSNFWPKSKRWAVNYVTSDSAFEEGYKEVGGGLSMSHFFCKISYLNIFSLIFENSYLYGENL